MCTKKHTNTKMRFPNIVKHFDGNFKLLKVETHTLAKASFAQ